MQHEITKITKIKEINNEWAHNFYMVVNGRTYNDEHKRYYTWHFVEWFDIFDLQEWFEDENGKIPKLNEQRQKEYARELAWAFIDGEGWRDYQNNEQRDKFINACNETIIDYNKYSE